MSDITSIQEQFRNKAMEARGNLADMGHLAKEAVQEKLHDLKDSAAGKLAEGKVKLHEFEETLARKVRESPMTSVFIALGVGAVLSFLWRRR